MPARAVTTHPVFMQAFPFGTSPFFRDMACLAEALANASTEVDKTKSGQRAMLLDVKEAEDAIEVRADIPGVTKEDIKVDIEKNVLTLAVDHAEEDGGTEPDKQATGPKEGQQTPTWHFTERLRAFVKRTIKLPESADTSAGTASYADGVLSISFPKKPLLDTSTKLTIH